MRGLLLVLVCLVPMVNAAIDAYPFPNDELRARYHALIDELRCPQCLNTNLAGSDAMIASDLRREVHRLLLEGKSDQEVLDFMQARYGDFILYEPRLTLPTVFLWFGPLIFLVVAGLTGIVVVRRGASDPVEKPDTARLDELLHGRSDARSDTRSDPHTDSHSERQEPP
ncbi:MAG: cytochrome c-type biogenesis protein CcmH [Proteobacteria bacterium]|jgi:cytochrome c-type biogenesis protein CcmH|nr:cytochrome c-type biogenesis protein CcmH [Pseudomonadota bacterium]